MIEALHFGFMQNAILAGLLASIACGIIGTYVVVNRIVFISGGIAHAAFGGIGLAFFLGFSPLLGAAGFALVVSAVIAFVTLKEKHRSDTIIGVVWAVGMALGVILIDLTPGYNVDLMSYLFGSILTVPTNDLLLMVVMDCIIVATVMVFYRNLLALSYDDEFAAVRGVPVKTLYVALLAMTAISVVMIIRVVGLILVIALLTIPPYISEKYCRSIGMMMVWSIVISAVCVLVGLSFSYTLNLTSGATIIMTAAVAFFGSLIYDMIRKRIAPSE
jgi:zinc transport system permease protein